jgi:hypothetical protein
MVKLVLISLVVALWVSQPGPSAIDDQLASWNDGVTKDAIVSFVARVTQQGGPDFVPAGERIATFDNDGTLWAIQES